MQTELSISRRGIEPDTPTESSSTDLVPLLLTIEETMALTRLGRTRLLEEVGAGRIQSVKPGRRRLFTHRAIQEYVDLIETEARTGRSIVGESGAHDGR